MTNKTAKRGDQLSASEVNSIRRIERRVTDELFDSIGVPKKGNRVKPGATYGFNRSGEYAPAASVVELCQTGEYDGDLMEFVKPGHADGVGEYGITVGGIANGRAGMVAISMGDWRLSATDASVGDTLGASDGAWVAVTGNVFGVVRRSVDGVALVRFQGGQATRFAIADEDMVDDYVLYDVRARSIQGTPYENLQCFRLIGMHVPAGSLGSVIQDTDGGLVFVPGNEREETQRPLYVELREDDEPFEVGRIWMVI